MSRSYDYWIAQQEEPQLAEAVRGGRFSQRESAALDKKKWLDSMTAEQWREHLEREEYLQNRYGRFS